MTVDALEAYYRGLAGPGAATSAIVPGWAEAHEALLEALESGEVSATTRRDDGGWGPVPWVKAAILAGFKASAVEAIPGWPGGARDKAAYPPREFSASDGVRLVPGGSAVRRGARIEPGVVIMPPSYVNVGASVGAGSMVDSHVLVGSCARVGRNVHLSAGVQIGGVLEPVGATPVVIGDGAFLGAQSAALEGVVVGERAVLAPGTILSGSLVVYDLVLGRELRGEIPPGAVVVP
ncbi:MAG: 2,3,4,5-tetrahydropyridine-2,6-dicarboxylate N-succinyltransferase, partial [Spirochaetes bacterium]|nr:2,3,4,5-tetrahydropyridine-2,6-dicarboxylate N-succinyltransferase [Spirochaetota bacterium]